MRALFAAFGLLAALGTGAAQADVGLMELPARGDEYISCWPYEKRIAAPTPAGRRAAT